ncbi:MAG: phospho-N-acetylmuramoyl-pentapeptide-transferase [Cyanobacteria bacterium RYN_339]|nr:phospho-N-acetylmuramoyl-pentapeptide-transferase [Cyanobacteria bacterium RYN_339]
MSHPLLLAILAAMAVTIVLGRPYIGYLAQWKLGQIIRTEGPESHHAKAGTPSMGGWLILAPMVVVLPLFHAFSPHVWVLAATILGFTFVGWLDDYLIVKKRSNKGLAPRQKLAGQFLVGCAFAAGLWYVGRGTAILIPLTHQQLDLGLFYYPLLVFIMMGTTNAVNLTDGLDGLASGTVVIALVGLAACLAVFGVHPDVLILMAAVIGGCLGFLWFNWHPAQVFMGDTGSLGLGAVVAGAAAMGKLELWLIPLGAVFIAETLSVMIQVAYFKRTGGKRFFKMSPLHHHFELSGWKETKVVGRFYLTGVVLALLTVALF